MSPSITTPTLSSAPPDLLTRAEEDPWALTIAERRDLARTFAIAQAQWLPRLQALVEPPSPTAMFPAYLIEFAAFDRLREAIGDARTRQDLDTGTADELQRFVDHYRDFAS